MFSKNSPYNNKFRISKNTNLIKTSKLEAGLYITSTPIGNIKDFTLRGIETLENVDIIACEDTRRSKKLLNYYNISNKLISYNDINENKIYPKLLSLLISGKTVAIISDAGTPLINDPGYRIVSECVKREIPVYSIPGPSSLIAALSVSGLPINKFVFLGFFPVKKQDKEKLISSMDYFKGSIVFFESPLRLKNTINFLTSYFPEREISICKELTKLHEKIFSGQIKNILSIPELKNPKGEYVLVLGPPLDQVSKPEDAITMLEEAIKLMKIPDAVSQVSSLTGISKKDLYKKAINLKKDR